MKQKSDKIKSQAGFTLIELLAVIAIMALISTALVIDFNRQRGPRNIVLAKNETITNLRKVQGYMLSSRNIPPNNTPAKYYIATFDAKETPNSYTVAAVDNDYVYHPGVETISLPDSVIFSNLTINRPDGVKGDPLAYKCMQIIFSAPFGKMYVNGSETCDGSIVDILKDPVSLAELSENKASIYFSELSGTVQDAYLEIVPVTGQMSAY